MWLSEKGGDFWPCMYYKKWTADTKVAPTHLNKNDFAGRCTCSLVFLLLDQHDVTQFKIAFLASGNVFRIIQRAVVDLVCSWRSLPWCRSFMCQYNEGHVTRRDTWRRQKPCYSSSSFMFCTQGSVWGEGAAETGLVRHRDDAVQPLGQPEHRRRPDCSPCVPDVPPCSGLAGPPHAGGHRHRAAAAQQGGSRSAHVLPRRQEPQHRHGEYSGVLFMNACLFVVVRYQHKLSSIRIIAKQGAKKH